MSLHAQLSPEAQEKLNDQRRNSTISSLIITLLLMSLVVVTLLIITLALPSKDIPSIITYQANSIQEETVKTRKVTISSQRKPSAPSAPSTRVIATNTSSPVAIPVPEFNVETPSLEFGDGDSFGQGWQNTSMGSGAPGFANIPAAMKKRCSKADRLQRLASNGGNEACEDAGVSALRWLKNTQNPDGSWTDQKKVSMTALAILAYMGHCDTTSSPEFGDTILNGLNFLINVGLKNNGRLASDLRDKHWCYSHSIASYALAESYTLCVSVFHETIPDLDKVVQLAGQFIIDNQHESGGWDYSYDKTGARGGDSSIVAWHMQALKALKHTDFPFKNINGCARDGLDYIEKLQNEEGLIAYRNKKKINGNGTCLTSAGALCYQMWGKSSHEVAKQACRHVYKHIKFDWDTEYSDLYGHYYAAQAMMNSGGSYWEKYNSIFRDEVLANQGPDGSFNSLPVKAQGSAGGIYQKDNPLGIHYRTCLVTLMLEVYYRFLPATGQKTQ